MSVSAVYNEKYKKILTKGVIMKKILSFLILSFCSLSFAMDVGSSDGMAMESTGSSSSFAHMLGNVKYGVHGQVNYSLSDVDSPTLEVTGFGGQVAVSAGLNYVEPAVYFGLFLDNSSSTSDDTDTDKDKDDVKEKVYTSAYGGVGVYLTPGKFNMVQPYGFLGVSLARASFKEEAETTSENYLLVNLDVGGGVRVFVNETLSVNLQYLLSHSLLENELDASDDDESVNTYLKADSKSVIKSHSGYVGVSVYF